MKSLGPATPSPGPGTQLSPRGQPRLTPAGCPASPGRGEPASFSETRGGQAAGLPLKGVRGDPSGFPSLRLSLETKWRQGRSFWRTDAATGAAGGRRCEGGTPRLSRCPQDRPQASQPAKLDRQLPDGLRPATRLSLHPLSPRGPPARGTAGWPRGRRSASGAERDAVTWRLTPGPGAACPTRSRRPLGAREEPGGGQAPTLPLWQPLLSAARAGPAHDLQLRKRHSPSGEVTGLGTEPAVGPSSLSLKTPLRGIAAKTVKFSLKRGYRGSGCSEAKGGEEAGEARSSVLCGWRLDSATKARRGVTAGGRQLPRSKQLSGATPLLRGPREHQAPRTPRG